MKRQKQQGTGNGQRATGNGQLEQMTRRGVFGVVAGMAAVIASVGRKRRDEPPSPRRRRRFWIGHT
jgi:hypothetical protein